MILVSLITCVLYLLLIWKTRCLWCRYPSLFSERRNNKSLKLRLMKEQDLGSCRMTFTDMDSSVHPLRCLLIILLGSWSPSNCRMETCTQKTMTKSTSNSWVT